MISFNFAKKLSVIATGTILTVFGLGITPSSAASFTSVIGDNDGFGAGASIVPDGANMTPWTVSGDQRSPSEAAATDGAQQTDFYTALGIGPTLDLNFVLPGTLTSGFFEVDMGGFQSMQFGELTVTFNGVAKPGLFNFQDGVYESAVRQFALSSTDIANANATGQFLVNISRGASNDAIAFDYFKFQGEIRDIPTPALLPGLVGMGIAAYRKRKLASSATV